MLSQQTSLTTKPERTKVSFSSPTDRRSGDPVQIADEMMTRLSRGQGIGCYELGCPCQGSLGERHWQFAGGRGMQAAAGISGDTVRCVAELLGYPAGGNRIKAMFSGRLAWAAGATEEDWQEGLRRAETKCPDRNPVDGSVREGWVRAVLSSVRERR